GSAARGALATRPPPPDASCSGPLPSYATPSWNCDMMMTLAHGSRSHRPDSTRDPKGELWDRATCDRLAWFNGDHARESAPGLLGHPPGHLVAAGGRARFLHLQRRVICDDRQPRSAA